MEPNSDNYSPLVDEVNGSKAIVYEGRITTLRLSYVVFQGNYEELRNFCLIKNHPEKIMDLWDYNNRKLFDKFLVELVRLFQNYLSSAKSLVEQTNVVIREWYKGTDFLKEYQYQIDSRFRGNSLIRFIEDLRNYCLHYALPICNATFTLSPINQGKGVMKVRFSFVLKKKNLLEWAGWSKGKEYLSQADDEVNIDILTCEYYQQIKDFHIWIINRLNEIHAEDFRWLEKKRQELLKEMSLEERKDRGLI